MAVNMFLKLEGPDLKGESKIKGHEDEIDIDAWSWGATQTGSAHRGGGAGTAKADVQDLHISKKSDKASPILFGKLCTGTHFDRATLTCYTAGGDDKPVEYLKILMEEVFVTSLQMGGNDGGEMVNESLSLNFAKVQMIYTPQTTKGTPDVPVDQKWNVLLNAES